MTSVQSRIVPWTPEEDEWLAAAVASCESRAIPLQLPFSPEPTGGSRVCWKKVATSMPGTFTGHLRFIRPLISLSAGRNNKSCRKRWLHSLDPKLRKGEINYLEIHVSFLYTQYLGRWTAEEDAALLESVAKYGKRWYEVARALPGRTDDQCAKRYKDAVDPSIRKRKSPPYRTLTHSPRREGPLDGGGR
jgi:Myb-like DNA-binding domain